MTVQEPEGEYREKYVVFLDMLGFSKMVLQTANDSNGRKAIIDAILRLRDTACNNPRSGLIITYFSDCIVVSSNRNPAALFDLLRSVTMIAGNLLQVGVLVRGGLSVGGLYHDQDFMFGPAMLEAYRLESREAKNPCILVNQAVVDDSQQSNLGDWFIADEDEPERVYVHYLREFSEYDPTPRSGLLVRDGAARLVRHFIAKGLQHEEEPVRAKANWLRRYWDDTVASRGFLGPVDEESDLQRPAEQPFRTILRPIASPVSLRAPEAVARGGEEDKGE